MKRSAKVLSPESKQKKTIPCDPDTKRAFTMMFRFLVALFAGVRAKLRRNAWLTFLSTSVMLF
jgi:hypothetical protein